MKAFTYINCIYRDPLHRSCFFDRKINFTFFFLIYRRGNDIRKAARGTVPRVKKNQSFSCGARRGQTERGYI